jgi:hypothetical protein
MTQVYPARCARCGTGIGTREEWSYGGAGGEDYTDCGEIDPNEFYGGEYDGDSYCDECYDELTAEEGDPGMKITISRPANSINVSGDKYVLGEDGKPLSFATVKEAVNYLADRNYTMANLREIDFTIEEDENDLSLG